MSQPGVAEALLRERLPPAIAAKLKPGEPERVAGSFVDEELRVALADRLFRVAAVPPLPASIYALIEAKAARDRRYPLQCLRYMVRTWTRLDREARSSGLLPPILPLVVYHGRDPWKVPTRFSELVQGGGVLRDHLLDFPYTVIDVGRIDDAQLSANPTLRAGLMALKYAKRPADQPGKLEAVLHALAATSGEFQRTGLIYILETYTRVHRAVVIAAARRIIPAGERIMRTIAQQWKAEAERKGERKGELKGERKGELKGKREGEREGKAKLLQRLLERRFGALSNEQLARIRAADSARLDKWGDKVLDAQDLDAVFSDRSRRDRH